MHGADVCTLLKGDHEKLRLLLDEMDEVQDPRQRSARMTQIRHELDIHRELAEKIFYPAVREAVGDGRSMLVVQHAQEEHKHAERAMQALEGADPRSEAFRERLEVLRSLIAKHADEEEVQVFAEVRRVMDTYTMQKVGERLNRRRLEMERLDPGGRAEHLKEEGRV